MNLHDPIRMNPQGDWRLWVVTAVIGLAYLLT